MVEIWCLTEGVIAMALVGETDDDRFDCVVAIALPFFFSPPPTSIGGVFPGHAPQRLNSSWTDADQASNRDVERRRSDPAGTNRRQTRRPKPMITFAYRLNCLPVVFSRSYRRNDARSVVSSGRPRIPLRITDKGVVI